jgi:hypothetical protein
VKCARGSQYDIIEEAFRTRKRVVAPAPGRIRRVD